jgi:hypothetical protein
MSKESKEKESFEKKKSFRHDLDQSLRSQGGGVSDHTGVSGLRLKNPI